MGKQNVKRGPAFIRPMLCKSVAELPTGNEWLYEVKRGGQRSIVVKDGKRVKLFAEDGNRLDYPQIEATVRSVPQDAAIIDGEIVVLEADGAAQSKETDVQLCAFDLLHLDGRDLTREPIERRKSKLCMATLDTTLLFSPSLTCEPHQLVEEVRSLSLEAVVAKRKGSIYEPGQLTGDWLIFVCASAQRGKERNQRSAYPKRLVPSRNVCRKRSLSPTAF